MDDSIQFPQKTKNITTMCVCSVMSNYLWPHGLWPILCQWNCSGRILEWVAISSSRDLSNSGIKPMSPKSPALAGRFFTNEPPGKPILSSNSASEQLSENTNSKRSMQPPKFITALLAVAKTWKQPQCPSMEKWIKKILCLCVCVYNGRLFSHKKEWNLDTCDHMNGPGRHYTKWNVRKRQIPYSLFYT